MKRIFFTFFLIVALSLTVSGMGAEVPVPVSVQMLSPSEIENHFDMDTSTLQMYKALIEADPDGAPAMSFSVDTSEPAFSASKDAYGDYVGHFVLRASKPTKVLLVGSFKDSPLASWGSMILPPVELSPYEDFFIMDYFMDLLINGENLTGNEHWEGRYNDIGLIGTFNCMVIPVTDTLLEMTGGELFYPIHTDHPMDPETAISLSFELYPLKSKEPWTLGDAKPIVNQNLYNTWPDNTNVHMPQTGDSSMLTLWLALGMMSLLCALKLRSISCSKAH